VTRDASYNYNNYGSAAQYFRAIRQAAAAHGDESASVNRSLRHSAASSPPASLRSALPHLLSSFSYSAAAAAAAAHQLAAWPAVRIYTSLV